jgi:hypothetical protein
MARLLLVLTALALSSCASKVYVHPTKDATDFNRDKYDCQQVATQNAYQMGMAGNMFWIADQMQQCLEMKHGWVEQRKDSNPSSRPSPPTSDDSDAARYEKLAAQGIADSQYNLGRLYANGDGVPQDYAKAREWFEKAAAQGNALGQNSLGALYVKGYGVPQDYATALEWFKKSAAQGNAVGQNSLGNMYANGYGVPQDYAKAREWFEKSAAQGYAVAQNALGALYADGQGVPQDYVRAYMWYSLAAARLTGNDQKLAANNRDNIARRMTPAQVGEAQRLSQQCQTQQFKGC